MTGRRAAPRRARRPLGEWSRARAVGSVTTAGAPSCPACGAEALPDARFCSTCGERLPEPGRGRSAGTSVGTDELRPVTALFADIVGSTALGERLGPEEVKILIGECVSRMSAAVEEYGGIVQAYMGDGICAYFGVPVAHEDDPERAARAGLRILELVGEYSRDIALAWGIPDFDVRVGINSGETAVGLVGGADRQAVALGDTTNVAARLQAAAAPGTIAVGEETAARLGHRFALKPIGDVTVKGREGPVAVWRLARLHEDRTVATPRIPLVGRVDEAARLRGVLADLEAGRGQALLLVGDGGIGKTRMLEELRDLAGDAVTWLDGHCLSYGGLGSWPFIEILREWLGLQEGEAEIAVRTKARAKLGTVLGADLLGVLPAFGRLLRVRLDPAQPTGAGSPAEVPQAYRTWIEALTQQRPVVLALEDVHWADPSTRELAESLLELTDRVPLLVAATLRADTSSEGWRLRLEILSEYPHRATELPLGPLSDDEAAELLGLLAADGLDARARDEIISRAEGNPLYVEELLRILESGGTVGQPRAWTVSVMSAAQLSPALQTLLVARIDLLPRGARRLVQIAAVLGRSFPYGVLEQMAAVETVEDDLTLLLRAELVRELRRYPEREYTFKHGLIQEAALSTLTRQRRSDLHARAAGAYERLYAGSLDDHLEKLAHHYAQSQDFARSLAYLEQAAEKAGALGAGTQATHLWRRAARVAAKLGDAAAEDRAARGLAEVETGAG
jgi:class 3 adenylate cyclase